MKKIVTLFIILIAFSSCKNENKQEQKSKDISTEVTSKSKDGLETLKGDFVYYADAAVLQTSKEIYGVVVDEKMHKLNEQAKLIKKEPTDMVTVTVRGKTFKKAEGEEGWENKIEIKEIILVEAPRTNDNSVIKIGE